MKTRIAIGLFFTLTICAYGQGIPNGYTVPGTTLSPDHRYGVTVPIADQLLDSDKGKDATNSLVEMNGGRVVAEIQGETGWDRALNFLELAPTRWSKDGSLLLWEVSGKWCPSTLTLLKTKDGKVEWQTDILHVAQQAIVAHTKQAAPQKFAKAKEANAGNGSAFPEGLTVDVRVNGPVALPLHVQTVLGSNPKLIDWFPKLGSRLEGVVDAQGKFMVTSFRLSSNSSGQFSD